MNKLTVTPDTLKEAMKIRDISLKDLSKSSKICENMLNDILDGKRVMPEYLMKVLGKITNVSYKNWENMQNAEIKQNNFQIGERGKVL